MRSFLDDAQTVGGLQRDRLRGCSSEEIATLESKYAVELPDTYKLYLSICGHDDGNLHPWYLSASYSDILELTADQRETIALWKQGVAWERENAEEEGTTFTEPGTLPIDTFDLPPNAFLISGYDSTIYHYIECEGGVDSVVHYVSNDELETVGSRRYDFLFEYLRAVLAMEEGR